MKILTVCLLIVVCSCCKAQYRERLKESTFDPSSFKEFTINLKKNKKDYPWVVDFNKIEFIDCRADSTKLGFVIAGQFNEYHRVVFPEPAAGYLSKSLQKFYTPDPETSEAAVFVIKHLWVSERLIEPKTMGRSMLVGSIDHLSFCYINIDCYTESKGEYSFIGEIDTIVSIRKWIVNAADDMIKETFFEAISKSNTFFKNRNKTDSTISLEMLKVKYKSAFDFPVLKAATLNRGIYLTYDEFLNNNPSIKEFRIVKNKKTETLKSDKVPDSILNRSWGYSDGTNLNIHIKNNYYKAVRLANTFELAGPRDSAFLYTPEAKFFNTTISIFLNGFLGGGLTFFAMDGHNRIMNELVPYQLNIKEGTWY